MKNFIKQIAIGIATGIALISIFIGSAELLKYLNVSNYDIYALVLMNVSVLSAVLLKDKEK